MPSGVWSPAASARCQPFFRSKGASRPDGDRKSTRLNSSHMSISYAVFCLKKKTKQQNSASPTPHTNPPRPSLDTIELHTVLPQHTREAASPHHDHRDATAAKTDIYPHPQA